MNGGPENPDARAQDEAFNRQRWSPYDEPAWDRFRESVRVQIMPVLNAVCADWKALIIPENPELFTLPLVKIQTLVINAQEKLTILHDLLEGDIG